MWPQLLCNRAAAGTRAFATPLKSWLPRPVIPQQTAGKESNNLANVALAPDFTNRTRYSLLASVPIRCRWEYVFHHWLGVQQGGAPDGGQADWYGIDQYLYSIILSVALISMFLTPFVNQAVTPLYRLQRRWFKQEPLQSINLGDAALEDHVIIAGAGRVGQFVAHAKESVL